MHTPSKTPWSFWSKLFIIRLLNNQSSTISENVLDAVSNHDEVVTIICDTERRNLLEDQDGAFATSIWLDRIFAVCVKGTLNLDTEKIFELCMETAINHLEIDYF